MLEVIEIIKKMNQGYTQPYLCIADDGNKYIVKGKGALGRGLICEYICASIGKAFGLPIPDFDLIEVSNDLIEDDPIYQQNFDTQPAFASKYIEQTQEINLTILKQLEPKLLEDIFIFDYWVKNEDRTLGDNGQGNPNLFFTIKDKKLHVVDHNLAFDKNYDFRCVKDIHVGKNCWYKSQINCFDFDGYKQRMENALINFNQCIDNLPPTWFFCSQVENNFIEKINETLIRYENPKFWEVLK